MLARVLVSGLVIGCIYGLIALGYSLIYRASGLMNFCQGDILTIGAFLGYTFYAMLKLPFAVAFILTIVLEIALGMLLERAVIRRLLGKKVDGTYIVLATIAVSYMLQNGAILGWGTRIFYFPPIFSVLSVRVFDINIQSEAAFCIVASVILMIVLHIFVKYTAYGTAMRASAMDAKAAKACGVDPAMTIALTWGISAAIGGLCGMLIGPVYGVFITLGAAIGRKGFAGAVIGGFGNMYGALLGGALLGIIETVTTAYVSSIYKDVVSYGLLLVFLLIKPTGIFNERAIAD
ncbi:branched-chain amino acid ABC transporter permease [Synergistales bacterium]|nr:branched-chain amino acid ABC transporter permease [Synergistales bacterium]